MALGQLPAFMQSLGALESGNNYGAVGPRHPTMGRALGRWQIMESNWHAWSREAGIPGADWRDPKAQDRVATYKFSQYYRQFGSWDLVAVAWFAGPGRAAKAAKQGIQSVGQLKDSLGTSVAGYVRKVMSNMGAAPSGGTSGGAGGAPTPGTPAAREAAMEGGGVPESLPAAEPRSTPQQQVEETLIGASRIIEPDPAEDLIQPQPRDLLAAVFESVSRQIAGGERVDPRTLGAVSARPAEGPGQRPGFTREEEEVV